MTPREILNPFWFVVWILSGLAFAILTMVVLLQVRKPSATAEPTNEAAAESKQPTTVRQVVASTTAPVTQTTVTGTNATVINVHPTYKLLVEGPNEDIQASVEEVKLDTPEGRRANIKVYVLWQEASWKPREATFNNETKLRAFLASSLLQEAMGTAHVLGCVGLASNEMQPELRAASSDRKEEVLGELSDRRAFQLCRLLAENARHMNQNSRFVGIGLGYHTEPPSSRSDDLRQRAVVIVRINATSGPPFDKQGIENIVRGLIEQTSLLEFKPQAYSRLNENRPICWVQIETGIFKPDCKS